jgi:signal peptidase I
MKLFANLGIGPKLYPLMPVLTGAIFAVFAAYGVVLFFEGPGTLEHLLLAMTVVTGCFWLAERRYFAPQRSVAAAAGASVVPAGRKRPWWMDWTAGAFPIVLFYVLVRWFVVEGSMIPSESMFPTRDRDF